MDIVNTFFLSMVLIFASCNEAKTKVVENPLVLEYVNNIYQSPDSSGQLRLSMGYRDKVWYQDSMAIESVSKISIETDKTGTRQYLKLLYYRFSDLRSNTVYEYDNFSDTAKLIRKYSYNDTIQVIGGWNFKFKRKWDYNGSPEILSDTTINEIRYKRVKLIRGPETELSVAICYFRCDKDFQIFVLDSRLSKIIGCPFVKFYVFTPSKKVISVSNEIVFLANKFSPEEKKVFDTWKTYATKHPITN